MGWLALAVVVLDRYDAYLLVGGGEVVGSGRGGPLSMDTPPPPCLSPPTPNPHCTSWPVEYMECFF